MMPDGMLSGKVARLEQELAELRSRQGLGQVVSRYVPLIPRQVVVNGTALTVGTTNYDVTGYGVPAGATAVSLWSMARWAAANIANYMEVSYLGGASYLNVYAQVAGIYASAAGIVPVVSSQISVTVAGANTQAAYIILGGYWMSAW